MTIRTAAYLARHVREILSSEPFSGWHVVRSVENEPKLEIWYEFDGRGVEVICDEFERVKTVFLHRGGDGERLVDAAFGMSRSQVLGCFGKPANSGGALRIPGIGDRGAWDRFALSNAVLHVQYGSVRDEVALVTLMRPDAVP